MAVGWIRDGSSTRWRALVAALGLALAVAGCAERAGGGAEALTGSPVSAPTSRAPVVTTTIAAVPARRAGALRSERPSAARLPSGTTVPIRAVLTRADGGLAVPEDIRVAGWWRGGSRIGDPFGATLVAAHIDSFTQGLGPYAQLLSVRPGQRVVVTTAHLRQTFAIVALRLVPRRSLPRQRALFTSRGPRRLYLVTCAGPYVVSKGGYQDLAIVTGVPLGPATRGGPR